MKVKILVSLAGENFSYSAGEIVDLDDKVAAEWIKIGFAEPLELEEAVVKQPETAAIKKGRR